MNLNKLVFQIHWLYLFLKFFPFKTVNSLPKTAGGVFDHKKPTKPYQKPPEAFFTTKNNTKPKIAYQKPPEAFLTTKNQKYLTKNRRRRFWPQKTTKKQK